MSGVLVDIDGVTRRFGTTVALDEVTLEVRENEFFALLGPSGCGKTTLLRILAGLEAADTGTITLDGADLLAMPVHRRPVNLMFQSYALFPHLSVEKNVGYGLAREKRPKGEIRRRVGEVLDVVGLTEHARRKPAQLSGGERQRVALARAVVKRPRLLLLDEPLAALDRKIRGQMQVELKRLQHGFGITFVVVTHDQEEAMSMADRVAVMNAGAVEQVATPVDLYERPATRFVADFIGAANLFDGTVAAGGVKLASGVVAPAAIAGLDVGTAVAVSLRPERVELTAAAPAGGFPGTVIDVQFFGGMSHLLVNAAGFDRPLISSTVGAAPWSPGDTVAAWWDPAAAVIVSGAPST